MSKTKRERNAALRHHSAISTVLQRAAREGRVGASSAVEQELGALGVPGHMHPDVFDAAQDIAALYTQGDDVGARKLAGKRTEAFGQALGDALPSTQEKTRTTRDVEDHMRRKGRATAPQTTGDDAR